MSLCFPFCCCVFVNVVVFSFLLLCFPFCWCRLPFRATVEIVEVVEIVVAEIVEVVEIVVVAELVQSGNTV